MYSTKISDHINASNETERFDILCLPLTSILLALKMTNVDFLSLNIRGSDVNAIKTINFNKIEIKVRSVKYMYC